MAVSGYFYAKLAPNNDTNNDNDNNDNNNTSVSCIVNSFSVGGAASGVALVVIAVRNLSQKVCVKKRHASIAIAVAR